MIISKEKFLSTLKQYFPLLDWEVTCGIHDAIAFSTISIFEIEMRVLPLGTQANVMIGRRFRSQWNIFCSSSEQNVPLEQSLQALNEWLNKVNLEIGLAIKNHE